jgi:hypothetical protein
MELSADGKALNYFEVAEFTLPLAPGLIAEAVKTLNNKEE